MLQRCKDQKTGQSLMLSTLLCTRTMYWRSVRGGDYWHAALLLCTRGRCVRSRRLTVLPVLLLMLL